MALDYFPPVFLLTSFQHVEEEDLDVYGNALSRLWRNQIQRMDSSIVLPTATKEGEEETADNPAMEIPACTWVYNMSRGALKIGQRSHDLNELLKQGKIAKFLSHDLFKSWGKLKRNGPYDCIVADPPL